MQNLIKMVIMLLHLYCVDPSENISLRLSQGKASVMFSATFLPVNYFKEMISGDISDYAVYAHSPFDTSNKRVIVGRDVSSRYTRRNINEYTKIADYIRKMVTSRHGRYMIFFHHTVICSQCMIYILRNMKIRYWSYQLL